MHDQAEETDQRQLDPDPLILAALIVSAVGAAAQVWSSVSDSRERRTGREQSDRSLRAILNRWKRLAEEQKSDLVLLRGVLRDARILKRDRGAEHRPRMVLRLDELQALRSVTHRVQLRAAQLHSQALLLVESELVSIGVADAVFRESQMLFDKLASFIPTADPAEICDYSIKVLDVLIESVEKLR